MPKFFVANEQIKDNNIYIIGQDANHIRKVLRAKIGEKLEVCNKDTQENFLCEVVDFYDDKIECIKNEKLNTSVESNIEVTIFQGLPKADKMELIIQKSVELGAFKIVPVAMKRSIVKLEGKDEKKKIERWQKISEVAAKQCGRDYIPKIENVMKLKDIILQKDSFDDIIVAYEEEKECKLKEVIADLKNKYQENTRKYGDSAKSAKVKIGIVIGPEGGIDKEEIDLVKENGLKIVTLGKRILRTETVALNMLSILMYELEDSMTLV